MVSHFSATETKARPCAVSSTLRRPRPRCNSGYPNSSSSTPSRRLRAGCVMYSCWAAPDTVPQRTTAKKASSSACVIS